VFVAFAGGVVAKLLSSEIWGGILARSVDAHGSFDFVEDDLKRAARSPCGGIKNRFLKVDHFSLKAGCSATMRFQVDCVVLVSALRRRATEDRNGSKTDLDFTRSEV